MTGSALLDFIIGIIVLCAIVGMFFLTADKIAPDPWCAKIARIAVGVVALIALIMAVKAVFFGGGGTGGVAIGGLNLIYFAIGLLVLIAVVFIINMAIDYFGFMVETAKYIVGIVALIVLLMLAGGALFGGNLGSFRSPFRGELPAPAYAAAVDYRA